MTAQRKITVAAVQTTPAFLDREGTVEIIIGDIARAAARGAQLVVFPEAIVPGYPDWVWRRPAWSDAAWYERLYDQAVDIPGPTTERLGTAARDHGVWLAVGVSERTRSGTLYNTLLYIDRSGAVAGRHRKLVATGGERTVWGHGDGSTLPVIDTGQARVGGLICWENLMPLARTALYQQGIDIYLAPTWDNSDSWISTLRHIAREGRVFVVGTNSCLRGSDVPRDLPGAAEIYAGDDDWMSRGNTVIVGPDGDIVAGPLTREAGMLVATLDLHQLVSARRHFDPVGHYSRPDVLGLVTHLPISSALEHARVPIEKREDGVGRRGWQAQDTPGNTGGAIAVDDRRIARNAEHADLQRGGIASGRVSSGAQLGDFVEH